MGFQVTVAIGSKKFSDGCRFYIQDNGVLVVRTDDGKRFQYSPSFWQSVEDTPDDTPPEVTGIQFG